MSGERIYNIVCGAVVVLAIVGTVSYFILR